MIRKFALILALLCADHALASECKPIQIQLKDEDPSADKSSVANVIFSCHGGELKVPDSTTIHFLTETKTDFCYSDRSCGNLASLEGSLELKYSTTITFQGSLLSALNIIFGMKAPGVPAGVNGAYAAFKISPQSAKRYCTEMSQPICMKKFGTSEEL